MRFKTEIEVVPVQEYDQMLEAAQKQIKELYDELKQLKEAYDKQKLQVEEMERSYINLTERHRNLQNDYEDFKRENVQSNDE